MSSSLQNIWKNKKIWSLGKCSRDGRMPSQREWCPPEPLGSQELCSGCDCTAPEAAPWRSWKHLELSSLPTAVLGNFPQPDVFEDLRLKPSPKNHCQINTAEHQAVAAYPQTLDAWRHQCHHKTNSAGTRIPDFPLTLSAFIPLRFCLCLWALPHTQR